MLLAAPGLSRAEDTTAVDRPRTGGSGWWHHLLGPQYRCLRDNPQAPGTASVAYRPSTVPSDELFIDVQGGGSCNSPTSCKDQAPKNATGYGFDVFDADTIYEDRLYLRTTPDAQPNDRVSPFGHMNMAVIPCCTGDSHTGRIIRVSESGKRFHFQGFPNFSTSIDFLLTRFPTVTTVWLMGTSAGAGGVAANYALVRKKFAGRQVYLIEDATPSVPAEPQHWTNMATWQTVLPGRDNCTRPPQAAPEAVGGRTASHRLAQRHHAALAQQQRSARATSKATPKAAPQASAQTPRRSGRLGTQSLAAPNNGLPPETDPYWDDSVNEVPQPFPSVLLGEGLGAQRRPGTQTAPPASPFDPMAIPNPSNCDVLNETRQYNRGLNPNFRYSILSDAWDQVLLASDLLRNEANDNAYFSAMSANDSAVTAVAPANTRTQYFDNRDVRRNPLEDPDPDGQGDLCGRHVVTLTKQQYINQAFGWDASLEEAHRLFLVGMVSTGSAWASSLKAMSFCPEKQPDNEALSF